jgi:manganese/zinc/iron transport system permease protein
VSELLTGVTFSVIATGMLVGWSAAWLGTFLVLRGTAMTTDAISHSILLGIVITWWWSGQTSGPLLILGAALAGVATVFLSDALARTRLVKDDAAIGLVFPALFALGVLLINLLARDVHIDQHTVLLGEIGFVWLDVTTVAGVAVPTSLLWMAVVTLINGAVLMLLYKEFQLATFDPGLAAALGFAPAWLTALLTSLTSVTAVAAFDAVGVVLFLAFAIVPPAAAYLLTDRLWRMLLYATLIATLASLAGYGLATTLDLNIAGSMAVVAAGLFVLAWGLSPQQGLLAQRVVRRRERDRHAQEAMAVHLCQHENDPEAEVENVVGALRTHLGWRDATARRVVAQGLESGLVTREGERLALTPLGRALAQRILGSSAQAG